MLRLVGKNTDRKLFLIFLVYDIIKDHKDKIKLLRDVEGFEPSTICVNA